MHELGPPTLKQLRLRLARLEQPETDAYLEATEAALTPLQRLLLYKAAAKIAARP